MLAAVLLAVLVGACGGGGSHRAVLDGSPRFPDREGVVTDVTLSSLTLNGRDHFSIDRDLQCFSTYTLESVPLLGRKNQYVQLGVKGKKVTWLASFAAVVHLPNEPPVVFYNGKLLRIDGEHRAIFRDGSVLRLAPGITAPKGADVVRAEIDPATQRVRALVAG